eukprot:CAMPEP_0118944846 /NCGR_PEP_ID=MMETSP1169-20130426/41125_1 /TAXON_ID=36882 /ORGANISM="Pyramimonas obovata, Strain CCMP722" /LENGTH=110 /DNA_ID=CAMNT_0006890419 /DNA_START=62 /DNA_END=390 /DNA_ORIENTATION=-
MTGRDRTYEASSSNAQETTTASAILYRPVQPSDLDQLKEAHTQLFPIDYEQDFYHKAVQGLDCIFSWVAVVEDMELGGERLVGFITVKMQNVNDEIEADQELLGWDLDVL